MPLGYSIPRYSTLRLLELTFVAAISCALLVKLDRLAAQFAACLIAPLLLGWMLQLHKTKHRFMMYVAAPSVFLLSGAFTGICFSLSLQFLSHSANPTRILETQIGSAVFGFGVGMIAIPIFYLLSAVGLSLVVNSERSDRESESDAGGTAMDKRHNNRL